MRIVAALLDSVRRSAASFHPNAVSPLARAPYRRELIAAMFLPVMLGATEGGLVGVFAKNAFEGHVSLWWLNLAVAALAGAPAFANLTSFIWASLSHGRHKIRFVTALQLATVVLTAMIAIAPRDAVGLGMVLVGFIGSRIAWSGVITLRSTIWRANYRRGERMRVAGNLATIQSIIMAVTALIIGGALDLHDDAFRVLFPAAAVSGLIGANIYRRLRVRGHRALRNAEMAGERVDRPTLNPLSIVQLLRADKLYDRFLTCQFIFGIGNMMMAAPFVIVLRDRFGYGNLEGVVFTTVIPLVLMPMTIPYWARLMSRTHIIQFRAVHSWFFVAVELILLCAVLFMNVWLLWLAVLAKGIAFGGGNLAWNLGHHDFAPRHKVSQYMGAHVTLTGLRGLMAPFLAVAIYNALEEYSVGSGGWVFGVCFVVSTIGATGFVIMARHLPSRDDD